MHNHHKDLFFFQKTNNMLVHPDNYMYSLINVDQRKALENLVTIVFIYLLYNLQIIANYYVYFTIHHPQVYDIHLDMVIDDLIYFYLLITINFVLCLNKPFALIIITLQKLNLQILMAHTDSIYHAIPVTVQYSLLLMLGISNYFTIDNKIRMSYYQHYFMLMSPQLTYFYP